MKNVLLTLVASLLAAAPGRAATYYVNDGSIEGDVVCGSAGGAAGDFHLLSTAGRYQPDGTWATDPQDSPCIDTGDPASPFGPEPAPNGGRVNLGAYGNTAQASRSSGRPWLAAVSLPQGLIVGDTITTYWYAGRTAPDDTVRVDYSPDGGASWTGVATGIPAATGQCQWDTTALESSPAARWRVALESDPSVSHTAAGSFVVHNEGFSYFVNDAGRDGDVYCTAAGDDAQDGLSPATPKASLAALLAAYTLTASDTVFVDTGLYEPAEEIAITAADQGEPAAPLTIQGSSNAAAGGSLFQRASTAQGACVFAIRQAAHVVLRGLAVKGGYHGILLSGAQACRVEQTRTQDARGSGVRVGSGCLGVTLDGLLVDHCGGGRTGSGWGVEIVGASAALRHSVLCYNRVGLFVSEAADDQIVIENNTLAFSFKVQASLSGAGRPLRFTNNIVFAPAASDRGLTAAPSIISDYNDLYSEGTELVWVAGTGYYLLEEWQAASGQDTHSLTHDPRFADPAAMDFHLRSSAGRFVPATGWVTDTEHSPCIDVGDPASEAGAEPDGGGGRINLGAFGGTPEASRSRTDPWLLAATLNRGGYPTASLTLRWFAGNLPAGATLRLDYSPDAGSSWSPIASGLPGEAQDFAWDPLAAPLPSSAALWRVALESDPAVADSSDTPFIARPGPITYYVNDASQEGDAYCTAPGDPAAHGLAPDRPKASVLALLDLYQLLDDDILLIDSGDYPIARTIVAPSSWRGITIRGSPPGAGRRTRLSWTGAADGVCLRTSAAIRISDLLIEGGGTAVRSERSDSGCLLERLEISGATTGVVLEASFSQARGLRVHDCGTGFAIGLPNLSRVIELDHCIVYRNSKAGIWINGGTDNRISHFTVRQPGGTALHVAGGKVSLANSILHTSGSGAIGVNWVGGTYIGTYNDLYPTDGAIVGWYRRPRATLSHWQEAGQDLTSISADPLFADPAAGDFHLRSRQGRWSGSAGGWVQDDADSACIDVGDPASLFAQEPAPNGGRLNAGAYGNTPEASKSFDRDGDGLSDKQELLLGTDPLLPDTDGDGCADGEEIAAGTDPRDAASVFALAIMPSHTAGLLELEWPSAAGRTYRVLQAVPAGGAFEMIYSNVAPTPPANRIRVDPGAASSAWFKVELEP